jgi:predicted kinase
MGWRVVVSGAPGTGKSTLAGLLANDLDLPLLSLDVIKEAVSDVLGLGDESWSNLVGDAAAELLFRLAPRFPAVVVEGWWRRERRDRAIREFRGWVEVFCYCQASVAEQRMRARANEDRHPIHRDVINPALLQGVGSVVVSTVPLSLGSALIEVDTTDSLDEPAVIAEVRAELDDLDLDC